MSAAKHDLIVIGGGPAGEKGAAQAAYFGKRVALIERAPVLGGAVANTSIPFKALRETALYLAGFRSRKLRGVNVQMKERATLRDFLSQEHGLVRDYRLKVVTNLDNHNVDVVPGHASFVDPHTVKVEHPRRPPMLLSADVILIACGSRPHRPPQFDFDGGGSTTPTRSSMRTACRGGSSWSAPARSAANTRASWPCSAARPPWSMPPRHSSPFSTPRWRCCCRKA
jgi:NAD(P) transhydrogenase